MGTVISEMMRGLADSRCSTVLRAETRLLWLEEWVTEAANTNP